jgi:hypothetical protein
MVYIILRNLDRFYRILLARHGFIQSSRVRKAFRIMRGQWLKRPDFSYFLTNLAGNLPITLFIVLSESRSMENLEQYLECGIHYLYGLSFKFKNGLKSHCLKI